MCHIFKNSIVTRLKFIFTFERGQTRRSLQIRVILAKIKPQKQIILSLTVYLLNNARVLTVFRINQRSDTNSISDLSPPGELHNRLVCPC